MQNLKNYKLSSKEIERIVNNTRIAYEQEDMVLDDLGIARIGRLLKGEISLDVAKKEVMDFYSLKTKNINEQKEDIIFLIDLKNTELCLSNYFTELLLTNKLGIRNLDKLTEAEKNITSLTYAFLESKMYTEEFTFDLFKQIHNELFNDIYYFSGSTRDMDMHLGKSMQYVEAVNINVTADKIFRDLKESNYFLKLTKDELVTKCAKLMTDLNILHTFRYGNIRTKKIFMFWLLRNANYEVRLYTSLPRQWKLANDDAYINAKLNMHDDTYLKHLLNYAISPIL